MPTQIKTCFLITLCTLASILQCGGQIVESKEFEQKRYKTFSSEGHPKNRGLIFIIKYPSSYSMQEVKNKDVVKGFVQNTYNLIYMVGVIKSPTEITKEDEKRILSEENLKHSVITVANDQIFLSYKNRMKINGMNSSYLEYMTNVTPDTKSYIRQYFLVYKNYLLTISFTVPKQPSGTLEEANTRFNSYKSFFNLAANTLIILK